MERQESIARAVATSGGAIVFAGSTVIIALLSLWVADIPLVASLGYASAVAVLTAVLAAITLLPAILSLAGRHLFGAKLPALLRPRARPGAATLWSRWAATVTAHPLACGLVALALLVPLIVPMLSLHLGQEDIAATPKQTTERQAFDLLASRYGPGYNGPLLTATELSPPAHPSQEYEDKYNQAKANQADLERKQKTLTAKSNSLKSQQASLERQQADLLDQKRQLQQEQAQLLAEQASLQGQAARLESQQAALQRQLAPLERQERQLRAEQRQLQQRRVQLRRQAAALRAAIRANLRAQAALTARVARDRIRVRVLTRAVDRVCGAAPQSVACQAARRALAAAQSDLAAIRQALAAKKAQLRSLRRQAVALARQAEQLRRQAAALGRQADQLARQAAPLLRQARVLAAQGAALRRQANALSAQGAALRRQADELAAEGASLQRQADSLQKQADALKKQQQQAEEEKKQTEQLKQELTDELTKADGDDRGTDPRLVKLQDALAKPAGVQLVSPPSINKRGDAATFTVIPKTRPADPKTADLVTEMRTSVVPPATGEGGITAYVGGVTAANVDLASKISSQAGRADPGRAGPEHRAAAHRLPLPADPRAGRHDQPAVRRRRLRRPGGHLPVGLGPGPGRPLDPVRHRADRQLRAADDVRGPVRAVHGLRGLPGKPDRPAPRRRRASTAGRPLGPRLQRQGDRGGGDHHDLGVRQLHPQRRPDDQAVRRGAVGRGAAGQRHGPVTRAGDADAVRTGGLVAPTLAVHPAPTRRHRGRGGTDHPGTGRRAPTPGRDRRRRTAGWKVHADGRLPDQTMPTTHAWPEPSTPVHEPTAPADGHRDHAPDD
jgi:predicted  nucleic acid-binding Zn-ribbon protein